MPTPEENRKRVTTISNQIAERIAKHLNECGVDGFIMIAYVTDGDGTQHKMVLGGAAQGTDPAVSAGLDRIDPFCRAWLVGDL